MKLELDISDEMWKRIEFSAQLLHKDPETYLRELLEERVFRIPDPRGAVALLDEIAAAKDVRPEDDYDIGEFLGALERNRGRRSEVPSDRNGEVTP
jgi:hypothetical protein